MVALRLQSAMEYLMTYGWAILIIAIVLGALFGLGFFNSANLAPKVGSGSCQVYRPDGPGTTSFINLEGTCNNELPQYVAQFNGQSSSINLGEPLSLEGLQVPVTITGWFYEQTPTPGLQSIYAAYNTGYASYLWSLVRIDNGMLTYWASVSSGSWQGKTYSITPTAHQWHFFAIVMSGSVSSPTLTMYLDNDGAQIFSMSALFSTPYIMPLYIGTDDNGFGYNEHMYGSISDIQIYNTSLSVNEIAALYQEGIGGDPIDINNLVGWWPLNGNANDYSGNLNNGVPTSVVYTSAWTSGYTSP